MENHQAFVEEGMLSLLISLSTVNDAEVRQYAAYACVKIAQNSDLRKIVTEEGGLEPGTHKNIRKILNMRSWFCIR